MKKLLKWFTLVEILIVIVIIGILIWALVPRMSAAQGRARDVARKNDLSNLQAAIVVAYQDLWRYPCTNELWCTNWDEVPAGQPQWYRAEDWMDIVELKSRLEAAWMNTVPKDPLGTNVVWWLWGVDQAPVAWEYRYLTLRSHGIPDWWFVLMAKTEVAWSSNRVTCTTTNADWDTILQEGENNWNIDTDKDVKSLRLCDTITKGNACSNTLTDAWTSDEKRTCVYKDERDLRYIVMY